MTGNEPDDRVLTPDQETHVRRLLADARHTAPTPDAVVARLDRVLADLAGEPAREATVVRLADRRRRAATMLVAAAASVAAVVGIGQVISGSGGDAEMATSEAGDSEEDGEVPGAASGDSALRGDGQDLDEASGNRMSDRRMPFSVQPEEFARDAEALKSRVSVASGGLGDQSGAPEAAYDGLDRVQNRAVCEPGAWGVGSYVAVLYDGAEGWVVLRRPRGDTQIVDLFLCGSESVARSVTLPHP